MEMNLRRNRAGAVRFSDEMVGFELAAEDDEIGKIDHASFDGSWATVAVGRLHKVRYAIPAWAIGDVDTDDETVSVGLAKEDVLESPPYDSHVGLDGDYTEAVDAHYRESRDRSRPRTIA